MNELLIIIFKKGLGVKYFSRDIENRNVKQNLFYAYSIVIIDF